MTQQLDQGIGEPTTTTKVEGISVNTLLPLQTVCVKTRNTFYRISVTDPRTGRALIEGGPFAEPVDALVYGSGLSGEFKFGWIGVGMRLEFWTQSTRISTSPVQSLRVESHEPIESIRTH